MKIEKDIKQYDIKTEIKTEESRHIQAFESIEDSIS